MIPIEKLIRNKFHDNNRNVSVNTICVIGNNSELFSSTNLGINESGVERSSSCKLFKKNPFTINKRFLGVLPSRQYFHHSSLHVPKNWENLEMYIHIRVYLKYFLKKKTSNCRNYIFEWEILIFTHYFFIGNFYNIV